MRVGRIVAVSAERIRRSLFIKVFKVALPQRLCWYVKNH
jgi:hypothetical protein